MIAFILFLKFSNNNNKKKKKKKLKLNAYFSPQISPTKSRNCIYCEDLDMQKNNLHISIQFLD